MSEPVDMPTLDDVLRAGLTEADHVKFSGWWPDLPERDRRKLVVYLAALSGLEWPQ